MGSYANWNGEHLSQEQHRRERNALLAQESHRLFNRARLFAQLRRIWGWLSRRPTALPCGQELLRGAIPLAPYPSAVEHIDLTLVIGSENRANDFDTAFAPTQSHTRDRWKNIAIAWMDGVPLEPVRLIQIGDRYLVRDGHHRVSVARAFSAGSIEAVVDRRYALPDPAAEMCAPVCV